MRKWLRYTALALASAVLYRQDTVTGDMQRVALD